MVEHQGIAPCIPVWKTGVYLSTPILEIGGGGLDLLMANAFITLSPPFKLDMAVGLITYISGSDPAVYPGMRAERIVIVHSGLLNYAMFLMDQG